MFTEAIQQLTQWGGVFVSEMSEYVFLLLVLWGSFIVSEIVESVTLHTKLVK